MRSQVKVAVRQDQFRFGLVRWITRWLYCIPLSRISLHLQNLAERGFEHELKIYRPNLPGQGSAPAWLNTRQLVDIKSKAFVDRNITTEDQRSYLADHRSLAPASRFPLTPTSNVPANEIMHRSAVMNSSVKWMNLPFAAPKAPHSARTILPLLPHCERLYDSRLTYEQQHQLWIYRYLQMSRFWLFTLEAFGTIHD